MSQPHDPYAQIAEWYDLEHDPLTDDIECYLSLLAVPPSGRASILEIGSGTGRILAALAAAGHDVTGVEPSTAMRSRAEVRVQRLPERVRRRIHLAAGTATQPTLASTARFDVVLYGLNTFAHLLTAAERHAALTVAHDHLRPAGQLLVDVDVLGPRRLLDAARMVFWQGTWPIPGGESQVSHFVTAAAGSSPDTIEVVHFYDAHAADGAVTRVLSRMPVALLTYGELTSDLRGAAFALDGVYGSHDLASYEHGSERLIVSGRA